MDPTPDPGEPREFSDSDQQWFDRLSGKLTAAGDGQALREADALRRALALEHEAAAADPLVAAATDPALREHRWQQLQFRLRRDGVSGERPAWRRRWLPVSAAAAAAVVIAAVLLPRGVDDDRVYYDEPPVMRGALVPLVRQDAHPRQAAEALAAALRASGLEPKVYQRGKVFSVDFDVPPDASPAALESLRGAGLTASFGLARVEIRPKQAVGS